VALLLATFALPLPTRPALPLFVGFMAASTFRMVPMQALSSRVAPPQQRARFMSSQSVVQHLSSAIGAFTSTRLLHELPGGRLDGMGLVAALAAGLATLVPAIMWRVERQVRRRARPPVAEAPTVAFTVARPGRLDAAPSIVERMSARSAPGSNGGGGYGMARGSREEGP
jgi:hypothetical protein